MERTEIELTENEFQILDELVFTNHCNELRKKVLMEDSEMRIAIIHLLELKFINICYPSPDEQIEFEIDNFDKFYLESYYLATKMGLQFLFA